MAIFGALLGIESWRGLELLGEERLSSLRKFFPYKEGIPSHQTIGRVFSILRPNSFEDFLCLTHLCFVVRIAASNSVGCSQRKWLRNRHQDVLL